MGFSLINHPAIGVPPWLWKPPLMLDSFAGRWATHQAPTRTRVLVPTVDVFWTLEDGDSMDMNVPRNSDSKPWLFGGKSIFTKSSMQPMDCVTSDKQGMVWSQLMNQALPFTEQLTPFCISWYSRGRQDSVSSEVSKTHVEQVLKWSDKNKIARSWSTSTLC